MYLLKEEGFFKELIREIKELGQDFLDFFIIIKEHTYDPLCNQFGSMVVNLFGIGLIFLIIMLVANVIINK